MRIRPVWALTALAAASWTAVIAADTANWPAHAWACCLAAASMTSLALLRMAVVIERNRIMQSLANAAITRPMYDDPTGPHPVARTGPLAAVASLDGHARPQHAHRETS